MSSQVKHALIYLADSEKNVSGSVKYTKVEKYEPSATANLLFGNFG